MAKKYKPATPATHPPAASETKKQPVSSEPKVNLLARLEGWLDGKRWWVMAAIFLTSIIIRTIFFQQAKNTPLQSMHTWNSSDMEFFESWAKHISAGDWLTDTVMHPYHEWHDTYARTYFEAYPEVSSRYYSRHLNAAGVADSLAARREMVDEVFKGKVFYQEPLYAYLIAIVYKIFGADQNWVYLLQFLLGSLTNVLVFLVGRRHFGPLAGLLAAVFVLFSGPVLVYEMTLLRTTLTAFLAIAVIYFYQQMLDKNSRKSQLIFGAIAGVSLLNQSFFTLFIFPAIGWYFWINRKEMRVATTGLACLTGALLLVMLPLFLRNISVGVPPFSMAGAGGIVYIMFNSSNAEPLEPNYIHFASTVKLMHDSGGKLLSAVMSCFNSFNGIGGIVNLYKKKTNGLFMWFELSNNMSYYMYKEFSGLLKGMPASYWLIAPLGICGLFFSVWRYRWKILPLLLMLAVCASPLFISASLSRYRVPFVVMLSLFAAFFLIDFLRNSFSLKWKEGLIAIALFAATFYYTNGIRDSRYFTLFPNDIVPVYNLHYKDKLVALELAQNKEAYQKTTTELMTYIPDYFLNVKSGHQAFSSNEANCCRYVATLFKMHATISKFTGKESESIRFFEREKVLIKIADDFNRRIGK